MKKNRSKSWRKRRRIKLWHRNPRCIWCGVVTIPPEEVNTQEAKQRMATLDHLRPKRHPGRHEKKYKKDFPRNVLACQCCNVARSVEQNSDLLLPVQERRLRAVIGHVICTAFRMMRHNGTGLAGMVRVCRT